MKPTLQSSLLSMTREIEPLKSQQLDRINNNLAMLCNLILDKNDESFHQEESKTHKRSQTMSNKMISLFNNTADSTIPEQEISQVEI